MDTSTLVMGEIVLAERSIRGAARRLGRPAASIAVAVTRLETALAVDLVYRTGSSLTVTLDADRLLGVLGRLRQLIEAMVAPDGEPEARTRAAARAALSLEALRRFIEVIRIGSIRGAARQLGMGQPQLTRQLRHLDSELGTPLLERGAGGCRPTAEGRRVQDLAVQTIALWTELVAAAPRDFRREAYTVRLGSIVPLGHESQIARMLATVVARWEAARHLHHLSLKSTTAEDLVAELKAGNLDLAILDADPAPLGLAGICITRSPLAIVGWPGFQRGDPPADILLREKVAVPSLRSGLRRIVGRIVTEAYPRNDRTPRNFTEIDSIPVIVNLVTRHQFVSVLPVSSFADIDRKFDVVALPERFDLLLWLAWPLNRTAERMAADILDYIRDA